MDLLGVEEFLQRDARYRSKKKRSGSSSSEEFYVEENFGAEFSANVVAGVLQNVGDSEFK
eukprot:CAMPEP_0202977002 /NCGR_PEP_ID=MMETSP1396-20130829/82529_1 /ASSEMBLY_ACC=CAM_ASM_000872 /TAXON_ID= /ORGANISM="Pseudokeronopsis sp., Strain Brazil" /LENGTH=59 /DNA_ID=CAMNT_0049715377 /DNA_START=1 /DNA_END=177 /DNA_ORIENTATION=+